MKKIVQIGVLTCLSAFSLLLSSCNVIVSAEGTEEVADAFAEIQYDYSVPVPESEAVDDDYFAECAFIGHSLIRGFHLYSGISDGDFYAVNGINTKGLLDYNDFSLPDGSSGTLEDALSQSNYKAIYIMQGINEMSDDPTSFYDYLTELVELVKESQPDATIYLISVTPTTQTKSENSVFNRDNIIGFNETILKIAEEQEVFYLDLFSYFADEDGYLPDDDTSDGIHFVAEQYLSFLTFLKTHTVSS